uniref:SCP domain-containing protein n=1 Tax=Mesocestoides corti TaxID=53468 RepID=A0A5K3FX60_MESCO
MIKFICVLALVCNVLADVPSQEERNTIMECHTKLREGVTPTASNMQLMTYSSEMEKLAEEAVAACSPITPNRVSYPQFQGVGFIYTFSTSEQPTYHDLLCTVDGSTYGYADDTCGFGCRDYKQMVWANSTQVGCASKTCALRRGESKPPHVMACVYKPSVPRLKGRPYEEGVSCSKCPEGYGCNRNQCDAKTPSAAKTTSGASATSSLTVLLSAVLIAQCLP